MESTHIALAAESASFSKAEINIGIIPTFGGTQRLPRNVGRKAAIELILTGRTFDAIEAARLGLINRLVPGSDLLEEAVALAEDLATKPPLTIAAALAAIIAAWMPQSRTAWRSKRLLLRGSSQLTMLEKAWPHSYRTPPDLPGSIAGGEEDAKGGGRTRRTRSFGQRRKKLTAGTGIQNIFKIRNSAFSVSLW